MAKNIMGIIKFRHLLNKLISKTFLLGFITVILLSGCGVKGDLYQTPKQPVTTSAASDEIPEKVINNTVKVKAQSEEQ